MNLLLERWNSPIEPLLIVTDSDGVLRALDFTGGEKRMHRLLHAHYGTYSLKDGASPPALLKALKAYFAGEIGAIDEVPTLTAGTPFQREVWKALRAIPAGATMSYGELAERLGRGGASRAVGTANGSNPVSLVVPCHRVVGANGTLTGYAGGLPRKKWLLDHESKFSNPLRGTELALVGR